MKEKGEDWRWRWRWETERRNKEMQIEMGFEIMDECVR